MAINTSARKAVEFIDSKGETRQAILRKITLLNREEFSKKEQDLKRQLDESLIGVDEYNIKSLDLWFSNFDEIKDELLQADYSDIAKIIEAVNDIRSGKIGDTEKKKE